VKTHTERRQNAVQDMEINVTGRHVSVTEAIKEYARKKLETHLAMDFPKVISAHFILDVEKYRHIADLVLICGNHITVEAREVSGDMYASIDRVLDKAMRQLRKYKTKIQNHRPRGSFVRRK
jgi:putative sigma-54 modulation protein